MTRIPVIVHHIGPACVQCNQTKRLMDTLGISYTEIDLRERPDLMDAFKEQGYLTAPIVTAGSSTWAGFKFERIKKLAAHIFGDDLERR